MRRLIGRRSMVGAVMLVLVAGFAVALATVGGIVGWEYSNSNAFCTNMCHAVHPEEPIAHAAASHARVNCVECHMGRVSTLQLMMLKPTHVNELWGMIAGYERPVAAKTLRPARDSCEACHWPSVKHADSVRTKVRYDTDAKSRETRTTLVLHTGTGEIRESGSKGIHWHVAQELTYAAVDPAKQKIAWVQARAADGKVTTWFDASSGVTREGVDKLEKRRMDCIDCHNAAGHPFPNPANLVDEAIRDGRISRNLPGIKARANDIASKSTTVFGEEGKRAARFDEIIAATAPKDLKPALAKDEKAFQAEMKRILMATSFAGDHITWRSFPNNVGHNDFPGCFRCHDGKHVDEKGQAIRLQCTLCHALPQVVRDDGARSVPSTVSPEITSPPPSHGEPNFMHDHRTHVDDTCKMCHGKIQWGTDGGGFCSNPACHGRKWPEMSLDVQASAAPAVAPAAAPAKAPAKPGAPKKS